MMNVSPHSQFRQQMSMRGPGPNPMVMHSPVGPQGMPGVHSPHQVPVGGSPRPMMCSGGPQPQQEQPKVDPISKARSLVQPLKEQIMAFSKGASEALNVNTSTDGRAQDTGLPKCETALDKIHAICDELEINLRTMQECLQESGWSQRFVPLPVAVGKQETSALPPDVLTYNQYVNTVQSQVEHIDSVKDILSRELLNSGATPPPSSQMNQPVTPQQSMQQGPPSQGPQWS